MGLRKRVAKLEKKLGVNGPQYRIVTTWSDTTSRWTSVAQGQRFDSYDGRYYWSSNSVFLDGKAVIYSGGDREQTFLQCLNDLRKFKDSKLIGDPNENVVYI